MTEDSVTLTEETLLRVKQLEVKLAHFEEHTSMTNCCLTEELEEDRVSLEKLEERVATLQTQNEELRIHLNLVVDAVNNITRVWNEQVHQVIEPPDEVKVVDDEPAMEDSEPAQQNPYVPDPGVFLPTFPSSSHPEPY